MEPILRRNVLSSHNRSLTGQRLVRKQRIVGFCWEPSWMAAFSLLLLQRIPLLLPGAPRAFTKFKWFTFSLTLTFVFCQSLRLNVQRHQDMLPGAKVKEFETHYKLKLWASFSSKSLTRATCWIFTLWQKIVNNRTECKFLLFHYWNKNKNKKQKHLPCFFC